MSRITLVLTTSFKKPLVAAVIFLMFACAEDPNLYTRTGFDVRSMPQGYDTRQSSSQNIAAAPAPSPAQGFTSGQVASQNPSRVTSDYYYRQPAYPNQGYIPQQYPPQPQYQQAMPYYQQMPPAYYPPQYHLQQSDPNSRFYANPYAIPPSNQAPTRYDADQFYAPPINRNNIEQQQTPQTSKNAPTSY